MARTNRLKLVASLIEAEIIGAKIELGKEVTSCNYGKASIPMSEDRGITALLW